MVIGDDNVQSVSTSPMQRVMRAYAAIDANDEFVALPDGPLQCCLLNSVTLGETMRHVITGSRAQHPQGPDQHRRSGRAINIIVAVNQNRLLIVYRAQ